MSLHLVRNGERIHEKPLNGETAVELQFTDRLPETQGDYRVETYSVDNRRAFTNPIYIRSYLARSGNSGAESGIRTPRPLATSPAPSLFFYADT
jgi:hypothetical protein